jgi:hypothetical protein
MAGTISTTLISAYTSNAFEPDSGIRWTNGNAAVPAEWFAAVIGSCMLMVHLGGSTKDLNEGSSVGAARFRFLAKLGRRISTPV